jgi:antitoxin component of MazEF toxin-antitoxin module
MKRRIIQQHKSYTLTLPIKWIEQKRLKQGDEVDIDIENGKIIIDSAARPELRKAVIKVPEKAATKPLIGTAYRAGYTNIILELKEEIGLSELNNIVDHFTGLEIEDFEKKRAVLRCISPVNIEEFNFFVRKIFLSLKLMADELISFIDTKKLNYENIMELRKNIVKSRDYCMRAINIDKISRKGACDEYLFIHILEKIEGAFWHMTRYIKNNKPKTSIAIKEQLLYLKDLIDKSYHVYLKGDYNLGVKEVLSDRFKLRKEWFDQNKLLKLFKTKDVDPVLLALILGARRRIAAAMTRYLSTIIELS